MTKQKSVGLDWLDTVVSWGEYRNVPTTVWRDQGTWCATLTFRDARGVFHSEPFQMPEQVTPSAVRCVEKRLDELSVKTRKDRMGLICVV